MITPDLSKIEEIYLSTDEDESFFVGIPVYEVGNWTAYLTYDEAGVNSSIYFFNSDSIAEVVKESQYIEYIHFAIKRNKSVFSSYVKNQFDLFSNKPEISTILSNADILGIGEAKTGERYLGKLEEFDSNSLVLREFDFQDCTLNEEGIIFTFNEIAYLEFSARTDLMAAYLQYK